MCRQRSFLQAMLELPWVIFRLVIALFPEHIVDLLLIDRLVCVRVASSSGACANYGLICWFTYRADNNNAWSGTRPRQRTKNKTQIWKRASLRLDGHGTLSNAPSLVGREDWGWAMLTDMLRLPRIPLWICVHCLKQVLEGLVSRRVLIATCGFQFASYLV